MKITNRNRSRLVALQGKSKFSLFLSLVLLFIVFPLSTVLVIQYHRHALAAGTVYYANPGDNIQAKVSVLQPGDTLIFNDGTYNSLRMEPLLGTAVHGTADAPITLKAANDGKAIFDPQGSTESIFLNGNSYVTLEGFVARNSVGNVIYLWGGNSNPNTHITLRRITAYNAASGNYHDYANQDGNSYILFEDCAGWGIARYIWDNYHVSYTTLRRTYAYWENEPGFSAPRAGYSAYGSHDIVYENAISRHVIPPPTVTNDSQEYASFYRTTDDTKNFPTYNTYIRGSMFYDNWDGIYINQSSGANTQITNSYLESPNTFSTPAGTSTDGKGNGINWQNSYDGTISNTLFANSTKGIYRHNRSTATINVSNSIFLNNQTAISDTANHTYTDFWNNGANGVTLNSTDKTLDPGYDTATYGQGAYLFVPPGSPLKGAGQNGADIGPTILYEYVDGVLTNTPLWPWPMEDRIMAERGISVTWAANGGLWKTLDNVYGSVTPTPTPTPTPGFIVSKPLSLNPSIIGQGSTVSATVTYQNTTTSPIVVNSIAVKARPPAGNPVYTFTPQLSQSTVDPGNSLTLNAVFTPGATDPVGQWTAYSTYQDSGGVWHDDTNTVNFTVTDTISPTVTITSPATGTKVSKGSSVNIQANAADNVGVTKVTFTVNGTIICTDTAAPYSCSWTVNTRKGYTNQITATAYDAAGNTAGSTIQLITQ
jgi:hypothetical protein